MTEVNFILTNKIGLHSRPAAKITKLASGFKSTVMLEGNGKTINAKSIILVMSMGVKKEQQLTIKVDGPDEKECIQALKELIENKFYEE
jgi:phosphocarrier protein